MDGSPSGVSGVAGAPLAAACRHGISQTACCERSRRKPAPICYLFRSTPAPRKDASKMISLRRQPSRMGTALAALTIVCGLAATAPAPAQEGNADEGAEVFKKC